MPNNKDFLFEPTVWRGRIIPSRVMLAPINCGFARSHRPTTDLLRFHRERSGPTIGISMVGNVAVEPTAASNTPVLCTSADVSRFAVIARAIRRSGSLAGIQLAQSPAMLSPSPKWRAPDPAAEGYRLQCLVSGWDAHVVRQYLEYFLRSAKLAVEAGFDVVQIHAAHGYFLSLLLNSTVNVRRDRFSFDGPWLGDFIAELQRTPMLLSFRISLQSGLQGVRLSTGHLAAPAPGESEHIISRVASSGVDLIDLSSGFYTVNRHLIYPSLRMGSIPLYKAACEIASRTRGLVAFAGNVLDLRSLPDDMPRNLFCNVGRAFIADADFTKKSREGRFGEIARCERTGHCHYFTRGKPRIECGVNRRLGQKQEEP